MKKLLTLFFVVLITAFSWSVGLSGIYSIGTNTILGEAGNYASLAAAVTDLNANGVGGPCTFYFTDNTTYTDTAVSLGCTGTSSTNTITFKPYTGITATINFTSEFAKSIDGMWVIGSPNNLNSNLVSTHYVTIDGSNSVGGSTKDLTIQGPVTAFQRSVFRIFGDNDNITIKNCIINNRSTSASSTSPIQFTDYNASSVNYIPDNYTIQNNTLSSVAGNGGLGVFLSNSGTPTVGMTGATISNNIISHRGTRGIMCNYVNDANIFGNSISADMQLGSGAGAGIWLSTGTSNAGTFNIYDNNFTELKTLNNTAGASNGYIAIDNQFASPKIVNIYNNFITGFKTVATNSNCKLYGIRHAGSSTTNAYHNTIYLPEMVNMTTFGTSFIAGIVFANTSEASPGTAAVMISKNNIIYSDETSMKTYGIRRGGTTGSFTSDYNDIYYNPSNANGYTGMDNVTDQQTLTNWINNTAYDDNSVSVAVTFFSPPDLHLAGSSVGDPNLLGTTGTGIGTDIDGDTRLSPPAGPYMGADEGATALPVELSSFSASVKNNFVQLAWKTTTEVNSASFQVQRKSERTDWTKIGEVIAAGNSNSPKDYSFSDKNLASGKYQYRLKMIDADGSYQFSNTAEAEISLPTEFSLSQNYPNPFNPTTVINYSIPFDTDVRLDIYSVNGELVRSLVNETQSTGSYNVQFDASDLASGTYIYRMIAKDFVQTKKMQLIK